MKKVMGKSIALLACLASSAVMASNTQQQPTSPPKTSVAMPVVMKPATKILGLMVTNTKPVALQVIGTNGEEPCRLVVKKVPQGPRDPVVAVEIGVRGTQLPVSVSWGTLSSVTNGFEAKGEAGGGLKACEGNAFVALSFFPPPPPEVNP